MNAEKIVRDFCAAASKCKTDAVIGFFTADAVYHNIPVDAVKGTDGIRGVLAQFLDIATSCEFEVLALAVAGNKVLTERVDRFTINGKHIAIPVMGTFELTADGKISAWRDYFDMQQFVKQMA